MKRKDALAKVATLCQRLDAVDPAEFFVVPLRLYVFGSVLTTKPTPSDVDGILQYQNHPIVHIERALADLLARKPLSHARAISALRKGMQHVHLSPLDAQTSLEQWLHQHEFDMDIPLKLVWEPGLDWRQVLGEMETHPLLWDPVTEQWYKDLQATAKRMIQEEGEETAHEWVRAAKRARGEARG